MVLLRFQQSFSQQVEEQRLDSTTLDFLRVSCDLRSAHDDRLRQISWKKFACREIPTRNEGTVLRLLGSKPQPVKDLHFLNCGRLLATLESVRQNVHQTDLQGVLAQPVCWR